MLNHFICGSGAFHQDEEEEDLCVPPPSSPRKSTRKVCRCRSNKKSSNPYSARGLDKFATVLLDLEKKRQMIYDQMNVQDISLVRFGYSSSRGGWVPIVVKYRNQEQLKPNNIIGSKNEPAVLQKLKPLEKTTLLMKSPVLSEEIKSLKTSSNEQKTKKIGLLSSSVDFVKWRCDYNWAIVLALVLFCLVIYGRSFAIICTSIWWYLVPNMNAKELNLRRLSMKKKDFNTTKRLSEKKMDFQKLSSFQTKKTKKTMERLTSM